MKHLPYLRVLLGLGCGLLLTPSFSALADEPLSAKLPVWFEENVGQNNSHVQYQFRGLTHALLLTEEGVEILLSKGDTLRLRFETTTEKLNWKGLSPLTGKVHQFKAMNRITDVPLYSSVISNNIAPGVDFVLHGKANTLEFDFVVHPGADPRGIKLQFGGTISYTCDDDGNLILRTPHDQLICKMPFAYQKTAGEMRRIRCDYRTFADGVGFDLGKYDQTSPLTIDPVMVFSSRVLGTSSAYGVGSDAQGNVYLGGYSASPDLPVKSALQSSRNGELDIFVVKLDPTLTDVVYATYIGGSNHDDIKAMAVDSDGNVYLGGRTKSDDFPTTENAFCRTHKATFDNVVIKLNPDGNKMIYSTLLGGESMEEVRGIAFDKYGNCAVVGGTHSTDFPTTPNAFKPVYTDEKEPDPTKKSGKPFQAEDAFVAKLNPEGSALVFCSFLGGHGYDKAWGCAMDPEGNVYVTGYAGSKDFPTTHGVVQPQHAGGDPSGDFGELDVFVTKFSADGTRLVFSTLLGGTANDKGESIAVTSDGHVYVAGETRSLTFQFATPIKVLSQAIMTFL